MSKCLMSLLSNIFERQPIEVQKRNGFDLSHLVTGSSKCGQLVPVLTRLMMPASKWTLGASVRCELPPLATDFFGRIDFVLEAFYTPCSALYGGWRQFISNQLSTSFTAAQDPYLITQGYQVPYIDMSVDDVARAEMSLADTNDSVLQYLGYVFKPVRGAQSPAVNLKINLLPLLCYHRICDVYYRNPQVTKTWFAVNPNSDFDEATGNAKNVSLIWHSYYSTEEWAGDSPENSGQGANFITLAQLTFPDGVSVFSTRQRTYARDYFTSASVDPQQGNPSKLSFSVDGDSNVGEFTISSLRAANSLQKFLEANNYTYDYSGSMVAQFGERPSDNLHDEPVYLGRLVIPVYNKSVYQAVNTSNTQGSSNPFVGGGSLGAKGASGSFVGEGSLCSKFHNKEFGYLMVLASLVPHTMYNYGLSRELMRRLIGDYPFPLLQGVGMDAIKDYEVYFAQDTDVSSDFAYIPRYSFEKYICDRAVGELRPGKTLSSFVLQRSFDEAPEFGTEFCTIPQDALDGVLALDTAVTKLTCWWEIFFSFKVSMPLAEFCVPTLGDLKDTKTIITKQGGSRL